MVKNSEDRRGAQRHSLPRPVPATLGGFAGKIIEVSLIGCRIEHADRVTPRARLPLRFSWRGAAVRIDATVVRSEMTSVAGKPAYLSGLEFCESIDAAPPVMRDIVEWLVAATAKRMQAQSTEPEMAQSESTQFESVHSERVQFETGTAPTAAVQQVPFHRGDDDEEPELLSADYVRCTFAGGKWSKLYVNEPTQPGDGFTIPTPLDDRELEVLCRAYEKADAEKRRTMRASFDLAISRDRR